VTICPCCGFKFEGNLSDGCEACGVVPVGEALPRPEHELPSYARSLLLVVTGTLMVLVFLIQTIMAFIQRAPQSVSPQVALASMFSFDFWSWMAAAQTAAWRLKWVVIPVTFLVFWFSRKLYRSMMKTPDRFCGLSYARGGMIASALVPLSIAILIGVTVPERLRQRQEGIQAASYAMGYTIARAQLEYRAEFGTFAAALNDLRRLPDADRSIATALKNIDSTGYRANAEVAALPKKNPQPPRGAVILNASLTTATDDTISEGLSFTTYELPLPGADKLSGTEDDLIVRDGVITRVADSVRRPVTTTTTTATTRP
jgi:hypothetical protein